ncbi:MAG: tetratricopeptide (TPR) repeat protein [Crocinitomicaceae bacterium]|jgi:tetratricopeptide (TPR) repeat protein
MMKSILASGILLAALLTSCGEPATITNKIKEQKRIDIELAESDLFQTGKILAFLENDEKYLEDANKLFLQGLDAFKNKKNLDSADYYLRHSILKEPSGKAYFELGNVYMSNKNYAKALQSFELAENLDYQPFSKILYNKSCLYSLQKKTKMSAQYLEYALQAGYNNLDHISKDTDLKELRASNHFKPAFEKGLRGMSNPENLFWLQFKKLFPKYSIPHTAPMQMDDKMVAGLQYISYDFEEYISEMRDEKFSREVSKGFYHYAQVYETEKFVGVVYIVKDEFMGDYAPISYTLATFTHDGKLIDKQVVGGREYLNKNVLQTTFNKNRTVRVDIMKPTYKKDPEEEGYHDNPIVSTKKIGYNEYKVMANGKIVETEGSENDTAASE